LSETNFKDTPSQRLLSDRCNNHPVVADT
jgi:hypothetical protein